MMLLFGLLVFGIALTTAIPIDGEFKTLIICPKRLDSRESNICTVLDLMILKFG